MLGSAASRIAAARAISAARTWSSVTSRRWPPSSLQPARACRSRRTASGVRASSIRLYSPAISFARSRAGFTTSSSPILRRRDHDVPVVDDLGLQRRKLFDRRDSRGLAQLPDDATSQALDVADRIAQVGLLCPEGARQRVDDLSRDAGVPRNTGRRRPTVACGAHLVLCPNRGAARAPHPWPRRLRLPPRET